MTPFQQIPAGLDPYEVAYLRGGPNEVARVVIVSLVERRILELQQPDTGSLRGFVKGSRHIGQRAARPAIRLSDLEHAVYDWFAEPRPVAEIFRRSLPAELTPYCLPFEERLQRRQLLHSEDPIPAPFVILGALAIAALGVSLTIAGLAAGLPVVLIVVTCIGGIATLISLGVRKRVTADGKAYLKQLRERLAAVDDPTPYALAAAVMGTTALAATPLADLGGEFKKVQHQAAASGCGVWTGTGCGNGCGGGGTSCGGASGCGGGGGCGGGS